MCVTTSFCIESHSSSGMKIGGASGRRRKLDPRPSSRYCDAPRDAGATSFHRARVLHDAMISSRLFQVKAPTAEWLGFNFKKVLNLLPEQIQQGRKKVESN